MNGKPIWISLLAIAFVAPVAVPAAAEHGRCNDINGPILGHAHLCSAPPCAEGFVGQLGLLQSDTCCHVRPSEDEKAQGYPLYRNVVDCFTYARGFEAAGFGLAVAAPWLPLSTIFAPARAHAPEGPQIEDETVLGVYLAPLGVTIDASTLNGYGEAQFGSAAPIPFRGVGEVEDLTISFGATVIRASVLRAESKLEPWSVGYTENSHVATLTVNSINVPITTAPNQVIDVPSVVTTCPAARIVLHEVIHEGAPGANPYSREFVNALHVTVFEPLSCTPLVEVWAGGAMTAWHA
ncbi:MAG TPA: choice-of-anchor P family protein [Candidatus Thermoplasmatota archaeon]|nr:choice-of-anchor P family protein [Candidatus Thermoplasmatota archaeon]